MENTYEKLLQLPLFIGLSKSELTDLVGYAKLGFDKRLSNERIATEHEACRSLIFLQNGSMLVKKHADNHSYTIQERIDAPFLIEPERLFGFYQHFSRTYTALTECHLITISKADTMAICQNHVICHLNLLGQVSMTAQRLHNHLWKDPVRTVESGIVRFLQERMATAKGAKTVLMKMQTLATLIHESRLNVSRVLNRWDKEGLVEISRSRIEIPAFERLREWA